MLQDEVVDTHKIINNTAFSNLSLNFKADDDVSSFLFLKDLVNRKDFGTDYFIINLSKHVKETKITDCYNRIIRLRNMYIILCVVLLLSPHESSDK